jgi:formylglycine-generating enzyme required for sulfatase activity
MKHRNPLSPLVFPCPWASEWGEDEYGLWQAFTYRNISHAFRWIPPGSFMMGSPDTELGRWDGEDWHSVTLSQGFWLAETAVTQALWQAVMGDNPCEFKGDNRPVEQVSWDDAQAFICQLRQLYPDFMVRLPWEAEWEYACRAGTQTPFYFGEYLTLALVNYKGTWGYGTDQWGNTAKRATAEVKSYPCNRWGLFEMHGNVWEWCADLWQLSLGTQAVCDPWQRQSTPDADARPVTRGGSWFNGDGNVRSAIRDRNKSDYRDNDLGLRLALGDTELRLGDGTAE